MRDLVLTLFIFGMLPACFLRPQVGLLMWAWVSYMSPHRLTWSFAYDFRFNLIIAAVTLLGIILHRDIRLRIPMNGTTIFWMLFIFWTWITTFDAFQANAALSEFSRFIKIQLMILATLMVLRERRWIVAMVWVIVLSVGFWGVKGGVFTLLEGGSFRVYGPAKSFFEDNNALALALITVLPLMRFLQLQSRRFILWLSVSGVMLLAVVSVAGSYSRGGLLGLSAMALFLWFKSPRRLLWGGVMVLLGMGFFVFMPQHWQERMGSIVSLYRDDKPVAEDRSISGRFNAWEFAVNVANDRPFLGGGFRAFHWRWFKKYAPNPDDFHDAHSIYFEVLGEHGYFGLLLWLMFYLLGFAGAGTIQRRTRRRDDLKWAGQLAAMIQVALVGYAAAGAFLGLAYFDLPYHLVSLVVVTRLVVEQELATASPVKADAAHHPPSGRGMDRRPRFPLREPRSIFLRPTAVAGRSA
ncbi:MAG: putative O-glycosylation ligase, exosortase A system-associated [Magnetococcus sp. WYHC-3]